MDAFNYILKFGTENKPNVLRALVGRLTTLWLRSPGESVKVQGKPGHRYITAVVCDPESFQVLVLLPLVFALVLVLR